MAGELGDFKPGTSIFQYCGKIEQKWEAQFGCYRIASKVNHVHKIHGHYHRSSHKASIYYLLPIAIIMDG